MAEKKQTLECSRCGTIRTGFYRTIAEKIESDERIEMLEEEVAQLKLQLEEANQATRKQQKNVGYHILKNTDLEQRLCELENKNLQLISSRDYCLVEDDEQIKKDMQRLKNELRKLSYQHTALKKRLSLLCNSQEPAAVEQLKQQLIGLDFIIDKHNCPTKECLDSHKEQFTDWLKQRLAQPISKYSLNKLTMLRNQLMHLPAPT